MTPQEQFRQQAPAPLPPRSIQLPTGVETTLKNGLSVIVVPDNRLPLVSYRLAFRSGDAHDPRSHPGLIDLLTGLLTEGTNKHGSREIADRVAKMGATLNAGANSDYTTIAASSLTLFQDSILDLLADVTLHPTFPENEVKLIKENTRESLKQQRAQPSFLATEMVSRIIFGEHPYSIIAPTLESLAATNREKLVEFHRSKFVPNNAVLVVAGDVDPDALIKRVESLFGDWRAADLPQDNFPAPPARTSRSAYLVDRPGSAQSNIVIANGGGITRTSPDYFPMLLMHTVLGANASSRLFMNLREEKGYTYGAYSSLDARRSAGSVRVSAEVRTAVTGDSLKEFFNELTRIRNEPVSEKEIKDAKSYLTGIFPIRLETQEGLIEQLVQIKMLDLPDDYLQTYRERIQDVSIEDVQRVANKYIRPDEAAIVIVGDGAEISRQVQPFASEIELYNTAGKRKEKAAEGASTDATRHNLTGSWTLEIETPFGLNLPATLVLSQDEAGLSGNVASEMGNAKLVAGTVTGDSFNGAMSFEVGGEAIEAQIDGEIDGEQLSGTITMPDAPPMTFAGVKD
ncbi:MAG: M16 family metallopeptidase [Pyrinomonadaceae bacterium]